jgi:hypothetical protein
MEQNELVKKLMWTGLVTGLAALASFAARQAAGKIWERVFHEEPPQ